MIKRLQDEQCWSALLPQTGSSPPGLRGQRDDQVDSHNYHENHHYHSNHDNPYHYDHHNHRQCSGWWGTFSPLCRAPPAPKSFTNAFSSSLPLHLTRFSIPFWQSWGWQRSAQYLANAEEEVMDSDLSYEFHRESHHIHSIPRPRISQVIVMMVMTWHTANVLKKWVGVFLQFQP